MGCVAVRAGTLERALPAYHRPTPAVVAGSRQAIARGAIAERAVGSYASSVVGVAPVAGAGLYHYAEALAGPRLGRPGQGEQGAERARRPQGGLPHPGEEAAPGLADVGRQPLRQVADLLNHDCDPPPWNGTAKPATCRLPPPLIQHPWARFSRHSPARPGRSRGAACC